jgi:hypothetical protein
MQINLLIWLRRRRNCKIGLITTSSSMKEIHQKGPPLRLVCHMDLDQFIFHFNYNITLGSFFFLILCPPVGFLFQTGFLGCFGSEVDAIEYYKAEIEKIGKEVSCTPSVP